MVYEGTVKDGVVVFDHGVRPPDGATVRVELLQNDKQSASADDDELLRMHELAVDTGVSDLATNVDHYLYGAPKVESDG